MHRCKWSLIVLSVLFVLVPFSVVAGELKAPSSEGAEILSAPVSDPSNTIPVSDPSTAPSDKYKKMGEKCVGNCDEQRVPPKVRSRTSDTKYAKRSEVINFRTYDIDHSEVRGYVVGGIVTGGGVVSGGVVDAKVIPKIERCAYVVSATTRNQEKPEAKGLSGNGISRPPFQMEQPKMGRK